MKPGKILRTVLGSIFKKPATQDYPRDRSRMPKGFRGKLKFYPEKCIGCKMCMKDCPSGAITIREVAPKKYECEIDLSKCIYCAQCVDSCPKKALEATEEFELAQLDNDKLKVVFHAKPDPTTDKSPEATQNS